MIRPAHVASITGLLLLAACGPAGCGDEQKSEQRVRIYASVAECEADSDEAGARRHTDEDCTKAFEQAQEAHKDAPQFSERALCEERYEHCDVRRDGDHDVFMPLLTGFLLGHALGGSSTVVTQPVYVSRSGEAYANGQPFGSYRRCGSSNDPSCSSTGSGVGYVYGSTGLGTGKGGHAPQTATVPLTSPSTLSRGGFGGSASSVSMPAVGDPGVAPAASVGGAVARGGFGATAATTAASAGE